ncbi:unnamed protein product [Trichobilharzia regenti]|nr:unnamed protein product [Trichobilharzia regenti]
MLMEASILVDLTLIVLRLLALLSQIRNVNDSTAHFLDKVAGHHNPTYQMDIMLMEHPAEIVWIILSLTLVANTKRTIPLAIERTAQIIGMVRLLVITLFRISLVVVMNMKKHALTQGVVVLL